MENFGTDLPVVWVVLGAAVAFLALGFVGAPLFAWTVVAAAVLWALSAPVWLWIAFAVIAAVFNIRPIRRVLISTPLMKLMKAMKFIPQISETEQVALKAGDVWVEGELFSGKPNFNRLMSEKYPQLTTEEKAFLDGPVEELCGILDDWKVWQEREMPKEAWDHIKKHKYWGMVIPKEFGGLGFSAFAHSEVLQKVSSRSIPACVTIMVPNSLGPGELLTHYGTKEQKEYYLPRLARGEEIPCFALTEPNAGSDAASIAANGVLFKGGDGKLMIRLNWNKRWITLSDISTLIGLAFRLKDPEGLLGKGEDLGITCALVPSSTPGVTIGRRHDPLGVPFHNAPTQGKDVVVSVDAIIGGIENAGKGWKMLMESLAAGRGISLPAQSTGGAKYTSRVTSAHATVRKQFGMSIGRFEGIAEPLARIAGWTYTMEAARRYILGGLDRGSKPPVITAIAKYHFTELARKIINDGMDIIGGAAITKGPRNMIAHAYIGMPISITVEGANILTRTLIIFGQGALRAHPYAFKEVDAIERNDMKAFDAAFWAHIGHILRNAVRGAVLSFTRGYLVIPYKGGVTGRYYQKLSWTSARFAFMADLAMGTLGGQLKAKGKTTGRFADILSWMFFATATLRRFEEEGRRKEDEPFLHWSMQYAFAQIQQAFDGLYAHMRIPGLSWLYRGPVRWMAALNPIGTMPSDDLDFKLAELIQTPGEQRDRLTDGIYIPTSTDEALGRLENAFRLTVESDAAFRKVRRAVKKKQLKKMPAVQLYKEALAQGIITQSEFNSIAAAEAARNDAIQVDDFSPSEYLGKSDVPPVSKASFSSSNATSDLPA